MIDSRIFSPIIQISFILPFLSLQLFATPILVISRKLRSETCYRLMFAIGVFEITQLLIHFFGLFYVFLLKLPFGGIPEKFIGAMNGISWDMVFLLQFVLAINRLGVMLKALILPATALHEMRWEKRLAKVLYAVCFAYTILGLAFFCSPLCAIHYDVKTLGWIYDRQRPLWWLAKDIEYGVDFLLAFVIFGIYIAIFCLIKLGQRLFKINGTPEGRILAQSSIQFFILIVGELFGIVFMEYLPMNAGTMLIAEIDTIVACGINPVIYIALNPHYRKCFIIAIKRFVLCIRNNVVQPTTAANHLNTITPLYRNAGIPCHLTSVISNSNGIALPNTK